MELFKRVTLTIILMGTIFATSAFGIKNENDYEEQQKISNIRIVKVYNKCDVWPDRYFSIPVCIPQDFQEDIDKLRLDITVNGKVKKPVSAAVHERVIEIQQALGFDQVPIVVYSSKRIVGAACFCNGYIVITLHKDLLKEENAGLMTQVLAHEIGHVLFASQEGDLAAKRYYLYKDLACKLSIATAASLWYSLMPQKIALVKKAFCGNIAISCMVFYATVRLVAEHYARIMHREELFCDMVATRFLAKTPEEKIEAGKNAIALRKKYSSDFTSWKAWFSQLWYPCTHPSNDMRIAQHQKTIDEQTALLTDSSMQNIF